MWESTLKLRFGGSSFEEALDSSEDGYRMDRMV